MKRVSPTFRRARRVARANYDYVRFVYGSEWKYAVGVVGIVLGLVVSLASGLLSITITLAGVVATVLLLIVDTHEMTRRWRATALVPNDRERSTFPYLADLRQPEEGARPTLVGFSDPRVGDGSESIWTDLAVNEALWERSWTAPIRAHHRRYRLPGDLKELAPQGLRLSGRPEKHPGLRARPPLRFNGMRARLMTEPRLGGLRDGAELVFQRASYFDALSSNQLWHWSVNGTIANGGTRLPVQYVVDARRRLLTLEESRMAHTVGISVLAITADGFIIFVEQTRHNAVSPGELAPSGSGSLEWRDVMKLVGQARRALDRHPAVTAPTTLGTLLTAGMLRELHEESKTHASHVVKGSMRITAYYRWLSRGAKPEFCGLVRLSATKDELSSYALMPEETLFTAGHRFLPVQTLQDAADADGCHEWELPAITVLGDALRESAGLHDDGSGASIQISPGTAATWLAAAAYVNAHRGYLDEANWIRDGYVSL